MSKFTAKQDAYGRAMWDYFHSKRGFEVVERDDGLISTSSGPPYYLADFKKGPTHQRKAIQLAKSKVLDVGCGAGRVALHLQRKGLDVLGIDNSSLAIKVCKLRGVKKAKAMSIMQVSRNLGIFNTIVMYGNNFGLFGGFKRARWLLKRFHRMTGPQGRIIAESNDPYPRPGRPGLPCHLEYHKWNRRRGRMGGQLRFRIRYMTYATPYFDYLLVSKDEMRDIVAGTGWKIARFFDSAERPSVYVTLLEKEQEP